MSTQESKLKAIADAIRYKEGSTAPIVADNFAERIRKLKTGGGQTSPGEPDFSAFGLFVLSATNIKVAGRLKTPGKVIECNISPTVGTSTPVPIHSLKISEEGAAIIHSSDYRVCEGVSVPVYSLSLEENVAAITTSPNYFVLEAKG